MALGLAGFLSGLILFGTYARMGGWGRLVGFGVALAYFGIQNSVLCAGQTIGKRIAKIEVVGADGLHLPLPRSLLRYLVLGVPYFLNGAPIPAGFWGFPFPLLDGLIVVGAGGSIVYLYVFNRRTRQSLHDLAAGTFVTEVGGSGPVNAGPIWRTHLAVAGLWCSLIVASSFLMPSVEKWAPMADILAVQQKLMATADVTAASVISNDSISYLNGAKTETTSLDVKVILARRPADYEAAGTKMAATVRANYGGLATKDLLRVSVSYGYDIGIAHTWIGLTYSHSPAEWAGIIDRSK
jgi:uncharacterized RDD family membrane protein YckC